MAGKSGKSVGKTTPLMKQYFEMKSKYGDALLLFRVGDFYETFGEDAVKTSETLGIVLTKRNNGGSDIALAGFPYHSLDLYLPRLVRAGFRVAICEQLEKPSKEKKIVKRGVTEVVTPGLTLDEKLLDHKENNYLASIHQQSKDYFGISFIDISTGTFLVSEGNQYEIDKLLGAYNPKEVILSKAQKSAFVQKYGERYYHFGLDEWIYTEDYTFEKLTGFFDVQSLKGFGLDGYQCGIIAAGAIIHYLESTEQSLLKHILTLSKIQSDNVVWIDNFTIRNLELVRSNHPNGKSFLESIDDTHSPMGARMLYNWVLMPLTNTVQIQKRLNIVENLIREQDIRKIVCDKIKKIGDIERIVAKISNYKITPRELKQLANALLACVEVKKMLKGAQAPVLKEFQEQIQDCKTLTKKIVSTLTEEPPVSISKGNAIASGVNKELDDLKHTVGNAKNLLVGLQQKESQNTGITNLKIGFNNVFGYYLEVTNKYKDKGLVPPHWVRKQTLTGSERYITEELKQLEDKILGAEDKISVLEESLFHNLVQYCLDFLQPLLSNARVIAEFDCLLNFANIAERRRYTKPVIDTGKSIDIKGGRHPVIEHYLEAGTSYIPNDLYLDNDEQQIVMITGPNMSGKSAILRQTALITIMSQMGSFVPAEFARVSLTDKIFTRVGASDNISSGESTFMVEMIETASIMNNISERSLILLDEIGRGTSTYDGISIAWSIAEYLHENAKARPKVLFATHYHELNELAKTFPRIKNFNVSTKEIGKKVIFLRKLVPGGSQHSFGIHVAQMAGMPKSIVARAKDILVHLSKKTAALVEHNEKKDLIDPAEAFAKKSNITQLGFFDVPSTIDPEIEEVLESLQDVDINTLTPIECMLKIKEYQEILQKVNS